MKGKKTIDDLDEFIRSPEDCLKLNINGRIAWNYGLAQDLVAALNRSPNLHTIMFIETMMTGEMLRKIVPGLRSCPKLKFLDFSKNLIDDGGAIALADWIQDHVAMQKLCLHFNEIRDIGAMAIIGAISEEVPVQIGLGNNLISREGIEQLNSIITLNKICIQLEAIPQKEVSAIRSLTFMPSPQKDRGERKEEQKKKSEEQLLAEQQEREIQQKLLAEQQEREIQQKLLAEQQEREIQQKLLVERQEREIQQKLLAEQQVDNSFSKIVDINTPLTMPLLGKDYGTADNNGAINSDLTGESNCCCIIV